MDKEPAAVVNFMSGLVSAIVGVGISFEIFEMNQTQIGALITLVVIVVQGVNWFLTRQLVYAPETVDKIRAQYEQEFKDAFSSTGHVDTGAPSLTPPDPQQPLGPEDAHPI